MLQESLNTWVNIGLGFGAGTFITILLLVVRDIIINIYNKGETVYEESIEETEERTNGKGNRESNRIESERTPDLP